MNLDKTATMKHFPADCTLEKGRLTFLTDKKIDAELYALLVQYSVGIKSKGKDKHGITYVYKVDLPT